MRKPTKETHYLIISLLTIAIAGGAYLMFSSLSPKPATITTQSKGYELLTKAQALVKEAEDNPTKEAIAKAQKAINQLKKTQSKEELQARLTAVSLKHNQEDVAIKVLKAAEDNPSPELKEAAQKAISKLSDEAKKAALQARLDAIRLSKPSTAQPDTATPAAEKPVAPAPVAPQIKRTTPSSGGTTPAPNPKPSPKPNPQPSPSPAPETPEPTPSPTPQPNPQPETNTPSPQPPTTEQSENTAPAGQN
ncbi:TPA: hypothetical protein TUL06_000743 [Streptococcus equi subsp. zooepidemicus]|uniref:hypothetical protein n=1 Tax=Streptococcus equi TaxID=1336 RepID=UPI000DA3FB83|nr:hypothetical protein [Streptococcus equi]MCD3400428.1 hypothetical protein [Streptococcus equi subsp. zooepidemicus]MCD3414002.1 hypothetical protein [Streptococcus equi subsp. zooepidemicus]MCD3431483.1 hypothetical protein [Streptococcus equi subsp. zooepidemicus]MDI5951472.1 hypothetical protein [Streptococcus equi subsp. zooepidemicus]MDI6073271.1 hypothetical protein [Streptococcus equi subsp. zooepidemicus]